MAVIAAPSYTNPSTGAKVASALIAVLCPNNALVLTNPLLAAPGVYSLSNASAGHAI